MVKVADIAGLKKEDMYISDFTAHTHLLAAIVNAEYEMVLVPLIANKTAKMEFCYRNVENKVKASGGKQQYGWMVL